MSKEIYLHIPSVEELWFRAECMSDPKTMNYNAGYNVSYSGYHKETGCIVFPKEMWSDWHKTKLSNPNFFYAYICDKNTNQFVGYCNFNMDSNSHIATMGIVIKNEFQGQGYMRPAMQQLILTAKTRGVKTLIDSVPENRERALKVFYDLGFEKTSETISQKFDKPEVVAEIKKDLF